MEESSFFATLLPLPDLLDLTHQHGKDVATVDILTTSHQFSPDAAPSGLDSENEPLFSTTYRTSEHEKLRKSSFGFPMLKFRQGQNPHLIFRNLTHFSFDLHWHGLNTTGDVDGATGVVEFGPGTKIGKTFDVTFPTIHNNSCLLWYHAHPMFLSSRLVYAGVYGLLLIEDKISQKVNSQFELGKNYFPLVYEDMDFHADGTFDSSNIYSDGNRCCFGLINGISCVNWYSSEKVKYVTGLKQITTQNLVKLDFLNGSCSTRFLYIGVCDSDNCPKEFYLIQTDNGLRNPTSLKMVALGPANRISLLIDLNNFKGEKAYVFFYNFDLTEVFDITLDNKVLKANIPDTNLSSNPTPNPTPIPGDDTTLTYPVISQTPQLQRPVPGGNAIAPQETGFPFSIKRFLKIKLDRHQGSNLQLDKVLKQIRQIVFGKENSRKYKNLLREPNFEYNSKVNYLSLLNPNYFLNLPNFGSEVPGRNYILFPDQGQNSFPSNPLGSTEYIDGTNRIIVDLWNSAELELGYALAQYEKSPNDFKPEVLPTCLFKIFPSGSQYMNYEMNANDILTVQIFDSKINYGDQVSPLASATLVFPATNKPLNIREWMDLVNSTFHRATVQINGTTLFLSEFLSCDWTFYPYQVSFLSGKIQYLKSLLIKSLNKSIYYLRLIGNWTLLQFFGKPMGVGMEMMNSMSLPKTKNYNMNIQMIFPAWATMDPDNPIVDMMRMKAELIIPPLCTYLGPIDGFQSDNLMNFSVKLNSSENWIYHNMDTQDSHPFHFHLTSGFVNPKDPANSLALVDDLAPYATRLYSMDVYGIGSQQSLSFYLKFDNYSSEMGGLNPPIKNLGFMYHCHYMAHHDMNMMGQYFVYRHRKNYF